MRAMRFRRKDWAGVFTPATFTMTTTDPRTDKNVNSFRDTEILFMGKKYKVDKFEMKSGRNE